MEEAEDSSDLLRQTQAYQSFIAEDCKAGFVSVVDIFFAEIEIGMKDYAHCEDLFFEWFTFYNPQSGLKKTDEIMQTAYAVLKEKFEDMCKGIQRPKIQNTTCENCNKFAVKACQECGWTKYCSDQCKKEDSVKHKFRCAEYKAKRERIAAAVQKHREQNNQNAV